METPVKYKAKKPVVKKKAVYEYFICYTNRCNKFQNALVDTNYKMDSKQHAYDCQTDLRRVTNDNFRAIVSYNLLRKKYINEGKEEQK